ncbi:MAG: aldehyde dehydrogenase, partial [Desulfotomaculales bacterium]
QCASRMTPGVEFLVSESKTGDYGQFLVERKPFGVIFSLMPVTHPVATMVNHAIAMIAAGNAVVFSAHPRALQCSLETVRILNKALVEAGGPPNLVGIVGKSDVALSQEMMKHPLVNLVVATGGPALAKAALTSGKKAIVGGPGNPPVIVDETADLAKAARDIMAGAVFDNNLLCVGEKAIIAVGGIKKDLARAFADRGTYLLSDEEARRVTGLVIKDGKLNPAYVGQDARVILNDAGIRAPEGTEMALLEAEIGHPLVVYEQMMPVIPLLSVSDFEQAVELARKIENNFGHTAVIHSQNLKRIHYFINRMNTTMVVVNAPSYSPLGIEGEGVFGHTIAGPTGEGIATAKTFTRVKYTVSGLVG